jgi:hypothetical protein
VTPLRTWEPVPKPCLVCREDFPCHPNNRQLYCTRCGEGMRRIQSRERMRRMRAKRTAIAARNAPVHEHNEWRETIDWYAVDKLRRQLEQRRNNGLG